MKTNLSKLHHQTMDWMRELDFYQEEIALLLNRLKVAEDANQKAELKSQFEDFRHEFKSLQKSIDAIRKDLKVREAVIENMTEETLGQGDGEVNTTEDVMKNQFMDLIHEIADCRFFFNLFLARS